MLRHQDDVVLLHLLHRLPGALEARGDDEGIALLQRPGLALLIGEDGLALDEMAELPFLVVDLHLAGGRFPDAAEQPVILAGEMVPGRGVVLALDELGLVGLALLRAWAHVLPLVFITRMSAMCFSLM